MRLVAFLALARRYLRFSRTRGTMHSRNGTARFEVQVSEAGNVNRRPSLPGSVRRAAVAPVGLERLTVDQEVGGSNPPSCTNKINILQLAIHPVLPRKRNWEAHGKHPRGVSRRYIPNRTALLSVCARSASASRRTLASSLICSSQGRCGLSQSHAPGLRDGGTRLLWF